MNTYAHVQQDAGVGHHRETSDIAARRGVLASDAVTARSEENISRWLSYLPITCVQTMIKMGWDKTT
jgi:hypothetical protein